MSIEVASTKMRPPGMATMTRTMTTWWLLIMASLPSTLNTQILDRAKMTPCKFNPLCICSNNGKKEPQDMEDITKGGVLALMYDCSVQNYILIMENNVPSMWHLLF